MPCSITSSLSLSLPIHSQSPSLSQTLAQTLSAIAAHTATEIAARKRFSRPQPQHDQRDGRDEWALPSFTSTSALFDDEREATEQKRRKRREKCPKCPITGRKLERKERARLSGEGQGERRVRSSAEADRDGDRRRRISPPTAQTPPSDVADDDTEKERPSQEVSVDEKRMSVQLYAQMLASVQAQHLALLLRGEGERDYEDELEVVRIRGLRDELLGIQRGMLEGLDGEEEIEGGKGVVGREESGGGCWRNFRAGNRTKFVS